MSKSPIKPRSFRQLLEVDTAFYRHLFVFVLIAVHVAIVLGLYIAVQIGRPRLFGLAVYVVLAIIVFDILFVLTKTSPNILIDNEPELLPYFLDWRVTAGMLFLTITVLALFGRNIPFYLSITLTFCLLLYRVLVGGDRDENLAKNLSLIIGASSTLVASQVFTVAYYVSTTDTIRHTAIVKNLVETGSLTEIGSTRYQDFLVFHLLSSAGVQLTGVDVRPLIALVMLILFQVALLSVILAVRRWSANTTLVLTAGILLAFNHHFLTWASKAHYQSLSFVFFSISLLALAVQFYEKRGIVVSIQILFAWIATHHLSFVMALSLATVPFVIGALLYWNKLQFRIVASQYSIVILVFFGYWTLVTKEILKPVTWMFIHSPLASSGVSSTQIFISRYESTHALLSASLPVFLSYIHLGFWLAVCLIGLMYILSEDLRTLSSQGKLLILSGFAVPAVFYFPNPLWLPLRGVGVLLRWGIMTLPFLVIIPAYGIYHLSERVNKISAGSLIVTLVVLLLVFTTIGAGVTSPSLANIAGYDRTDQRYLSQQDLNAVSFSRTYTTTEQLIHGSSYTSVYGFYQEWKSNPGIQNTRYSRVKASGPSGKIMVEPGLTIFQKKAFQEGAVKVQVKVNSEQYKQVETINSPVTNKEVTWNPMMDNLIYSNGDTVIQQTTKNDRA